MMTPEQIIEDFFIEDGRETNGNIQKSVLLSLFRDMQFLVGLHIVDPPLSLTSEQHKVFISMRPSFAIISVFCSSIDLLGRVWKKSSPTGFGAVGKLFKDCAQEFFDMSPEEAEALYDLRNSVSHQYTLSKNGAAEAAGFTEPVKLVGDKWLFNINGMYAYFTMAQSRLYELLISEGEQEKKKTGEFLVENGFYFTHKNNN